MSDSDLTVDVLSDILSRLPVKTLLQFRCVSKPWRTLIDSLDFVKMHLNRALETNSYLNLVLNGDEIYSLDLDSPRGEAVEMNHPLKCSSKSLVMGSCNGLLLVFNNEKGTAIWNPSTRKYCRVPSTPIQSPDRAQSIRYMTYGFGYDSIRDDYKVVRIVQYYYEELDTFSSEVKIYSLKSNSWRKIQDFPYYLCLRCEWGVLAGGALHWIGKQTPSPAMPKLVVAFNLGLEDYQVMPQPEYSDGCFYLRGVDVAGGCLSITCYYYKDHAAYYRDHVDVWVMRDYGVKESWLKVLSVAPLNRLSCEFVKPLVYSRSDGEILLSYDGKRLLWHDLTGKVVKDVMVNDMPYFFHQEVCVQSLVALAGSGQIVAGKQPRQEKRKENVKKKRDDFLSHGFKLVL